LEINIQGGDKVTIDLIKSINQAEAQAEEISKKSMEDARQILSDASSQSEKLLLQSLEDAEKEAKAIILEAEKQASVEIEKYNKDVSSECEAIKSTAIKKLDRAVEIIIGRIVRPDGSS